eukprot:14514491-Ditylum_brightwellii.AAC.1
MSGQNGNTRVGRSRGRRNAGQYKTIKKSTTIEEYVFYVSSSTQASDYEITAECIINYIKKTFDRGNNIAESLRNLVKIDVDIHCIWFIGEQKDRFDWIM